MGRYTNPKCRLCRREGEKLFLKGDRCYKRSCAMSENASLPGERPKKRRSRMSRYRVQLREKQKVRRIYGIGERQFRNYMKQAKRKKGITGDVLLGMLERRLDNIVYRCGFASSRAQARQLIVHGHFGRNGRSLDIPSTLLNEGDTIAVKKGRRDRVKDIVEANKERQIPNWMEKNLETMECQMVAPPNVEEIGYTIATKLIVEFYSR